MAGYSWFGSLLDEVAYPLDAAAHVGRLAGLTVGDEFRLLVGHGLDNGGQARRARTQHHGKSQACGTGQRDQLEPPLGCWLVGVDRVPSEDPVLLVFDDVADDFPVAHPFVPVTTQERGSHGGFGGDPLGALKLVAELSRQVDVVDEWGCGSISQPAIIDNAEKEYELDETGHISFTEFSIIAFVLFVIFISLPNLLFLLPYF